MTRLHAQMHAHNPQVQDYNIRNPAERERAEMEVALGERLLHVNVVRTLAHGATLLEAPPGGITNPNDSGASWAMFLEMPSREPSQAPDSDALADLMASQPSGGCWLGVGWGSMDKVLWCGCCLSVYLYMGRYQVVGLGLGGGVHRITRLAFAGQWINRSWSGEQYALLSDAH